VSTPLPQRLIVPVVTISVAIAVGATTGNVGSMVVVACLFIVATVVRVWSIDHGRPTPRWVSSLALGAGVVLATRLVMWFGVVGAVAAIVLIVVLLLSLGADLG
jgi:hypothetical protein